MVSAPTTPTSDIASAADSTRDKKNDLTLPIAAVILSGGLARRMDGQDKGLIELSGRTLVERVLQRVQPSVSTVIINANRNVEAYGRYGVAVVPDSLEGHLGPLAGLLTALQYYDGHLVFMCPCDSPFVPADMPLVLQTALMRHDADIAVATDGERMQPVFCLVHPRMTSSLQSFLTAGERKIDRWFAQANTVEVSFAPDTDAFRNINTREELREAERLLAEKTSI